MDKQQGPTVEHKELYSLPYDKPQRKKYLEECIYTYNWITSLYFPTQESNPGLPHCGQMLYRLSHQGSQDQGLYMHYLTVSL